MYGQVVSIDFLLNQLNWGYQRIDTETRNGGIEQVLRGGCIHYRLNRDYGQCDHLTKRKPDYQTTQVGTFVNRKKTMSR